MVFPANYFVCIRKLPYAVELLLPQLQIFSVSIKSKLRLYQNFQRILQHSVNEGLLITFTSREFAHLPKELYFSASVRYASARVMNFSCFTRETKEMC